MTEILSLSSLPIDALHHAVSFLNSRDALKLSSELNSLFRQNLPLSTLNNPTPLIRNQTWDGSDDEESSTPSRSVWIPVLFPHRTHSVVLTCQWKDQGHGNRKGALFVVAVPASNDPNEPTLRDMDRGKVVYESPLAPHEEEPLRLMFSYSRSKSYYLWYRVGGGGGHRLQVRNLTMYSVIHDYSSQWIGRNYKTLTTNQSFLPIANTYNTCSLRMLRTLSAMGQEENSDASEAHLVAFFQKMNLSTSRDSMRALEEMSLAMIDMSGQTKRMERYPAPVFRPTRGVGRVPLRRQRRQLEGREGWWFQLEGILPPRERRGEERRDEERRGED